jgi:hypothetical protein
MKKLTKPAAFLGYLGAGVLVLAGTLAVADGAGAVPAIDNGEPGMLVLEADPALMVDSEMAPGDKLYWPIATQLDVAEVGSLELTIEHAGVLASTAGGLRLSIEQCTGPWSSEPVPTCSLGASEVVDRPLDSLDSGSHFELGTITQHHGPYFLVTVSLPDNVPIALQGTSATIALGFTALGDTAAVTVPLGGQLPNTGVNLGAPLLLGAGLVLGGLVFARQSAGRPARKPSHAAVIS